MMTETDLDTPKPLGRRIAVGALLGALGAVCGYSVAELVGDSITRWDDDVNVVMGTVLVGMGVLTAGVVIFRPSSVPRGAGVLQVIVLVLAGVMLLAPIFGLKFAGPEIVLGTVMVLLAIQTVANVMLWRQADEMLRRIMMETSALAFWALQAALFIYAVAERLGLVASITAWGMVGIMMAVYVLASAYTTARRGIT